MPRPTADDIIAMYDRHPDLFWIQGDYLSPDGGACAAGVCMVDVHHDIFDYYPSLHVGVAVDLYPDTTTFFWDGVVGGNDSPLGLKPSKIEEFLDEFGPYLTTESAEAKAIYQQYLYGYEVGQAVRSHFMKETT